MMIAHCDTSSPIKSARYLKLETVCICSGGNGRLRWWSFRAISTVLKGNSPPEQQAFDGALARPCGATERVSIHNLPKPGPSLRRDYE